MKAKASPDIARTFAKLRERALEEWQAARHSPKPQIFVGTATCGRAAGALEVLAAFQQFLAEGGLNADLVEVGCLGHCYAEPLVTIAKPGYPPIAYGYATPGIAERLVKDFLIGDDPCFEFALGATEQNELIPSILDQPRFQYETRVLLHNCGSIDPQNLNHYLANEGYQALIKALGMAPEEIIQEIERSGLRGRGGAGFPTGRKWRICATAPESPKYVICNGDEGDPGAFMDRAILESDPHSVLEGMAIAGYAIGAEQGYLYVRAEYPLAVERVEAAIKQARETGLLGDSILGSDFSFNIEVFRGSGAFVCGEETALIASLEGKPGMPRHRPPFPALSGLWSKPTLINNVKTLATIPHILRRGAKWHASRGTEASKGTAVFALAGKIINTGLVEVPMGTSLRHIIFEVGGGIPQNKRFKAVQIGGPSGGCLPESHLDLPVDFDRLTESGAMMGSGGMVILDEDDCMVEMARYFLDFTQHESCGKCTPCRLGTRQMRAILERVTRGEGSAEDLKVLRELAEDVKAASLCGLGRTAPNPVLTTLRYFEEEYKVHVEEGRCPALKCESLIAYYIIPEKCERSCDACVGSCTVEAISTAKKGFKVIDQEKCVKCGTCLAACPSQYSAIVKLSPPSQVPAEEKPKGKGLKGGGRELPARGVGGCPPNFLFPLS